MFTSQWQEFAQLHKYTSHEGPRYLATTSFPQTPGEVIVQMFPSGRIVGRAAQTWFSHRDSPILCSIDTGIEDQDRIVIFRPQNQKLATVLSQALPVATTASHALAAQTNLSPVTKSDNPNLIVTKSDYPSSEERPWMQLQEDRGLENTPHLTTTTGDSCESCTVAGNQILDGADSSAEAAEQCCVRPLGSRTQHDPQERDLNFSPAASEQHPGIGHPQSSPCREYAADDRCIVVRPWQ